MAEGLTADMALISIDDVLDASRRRALAEECFTRSLRVGRTLLDVRPAPDDETSGDVPFAKKKKKAPRSASEQAMIDDLVREMLAGAYRADPDDPAHEPLFCLTRDDELAGATLDGRLLLAAAAARWAVSRHLDAQDTEARFDDGDVRAMALGRLALLEAEFAAKNPDAWEPYVITRGKRKGAAVWKHKVTGSLRDDPPHETPAKGKTKGKAPDGDGAITPVTPPVEPKPPETTPEKPPEPPKAVTPPPNEHIGNVAATLNGLVAAGAAASDQDVESWRFHLPSYGIGDLRYLHQALGLSSGEDTPKSGVQLHQDVIGHLYSATGKKMPEKGEDPETRSRLAGWQKAIAENIDPGRELRREARKWLKYEATDTQSEFLARSLGLPQRDDKSQYPQDIIDHLEVKLKHPGEQQIEEEGLRLGLQQALSGVNGYTLSPEYLASRLKGCGVAEVEYLYRSVGGVPTPGMHRSEQVKILRGMAEKAYDALSATQQATGVLATIQALQTSGKPAAPVELASLRAALTALSTAELTHVYKQTGLLDPSKPAYSHHDVVERIVAKLRPGLAAQLAADTVTAAHVAAMAALYQGDYKQKEEHALALRQKMADVVKVGYVQSGDDYAKSSQEADAIEESLTAARAAHRQRLYELLAPPASPAWKVEAAKGTGPKQKEAALDAVAFYKKTLAKRPGDPELLASVVLKNTKSRACASGGHGVGTVKLTGRSAGTAVHEFGHVIEFNHPGVKKLAQQFLSHRGCDAEPSVSFKKKFPGLGYAKSERGRKDHFDQHFGDTAAAYYVGKTYPDGCTEVISMGMEALYRDPAGFCARDPDYARFIIGILGGRVT